jgi:Major Facilitator Superfamily
MTSSGPQVTGPPGPDTGRAPARGPLGSWWVLAGATLLMLSALGWRFVQDPSLAAPTRDPAWYTWRANVIMQDDPASVVREWGPNGLFSGGYRVTVPVEGALLQRVVGIDTYSMAKFLMLGVPLLIGLALGAGAVRSRGDPTAFLVMLLATAALFLTTPYVGYLDDTTVLFLICLMLPFLGASRTSWGARTALFLIGIAAAFTHPTTCVLFGATLLAVFGFHFLTSRFRLGEALRSDGPMLMSVGFGMIAGLASWVAGIWGTTANLKDAALPPPYAKAFFVDRLLEWIGSMQPVIVVPFVALAIGSTVLLARRERRPANTFDVTSAWWLLPLVGIGSILLGTDTQVSGDPNSPVVPYYRFVNATAAPLALVGLGAFVLIWWARNRSDRRGLVRGFAVAGAVVIAAWLINGATFTQPQIDAWVFGVAAIAVAVGMAASAFLDRGNVRRAVCVGAATALVVAPLAFLLFNGIDKRWVSESNQYPDHPVRGSLAAVNVAAQAAGARPLVLIVNAWDSDDAESHTNPAYGWAKTYTNVFRDGLPGSSAKYQVTYLGSLDHFLADEVTPSSTGSEGYNKAAESHFEELQKRLADYPEDPAVFLFGSYYGGLCNGVPDCTDASQERRLQDAFDQGVKIGPDVAVIEGPGLWTPSADVVTQANAAATETVQALDAHPGAFANLPHTLLVIAVLAVLLIVPGWLAATWFGLETRVDRFGLIPGMSVVLIMLAGIGTLAVWRGSLTTVKGWAVVAVAIGMGAAFRYADAWLRRPLEAFAAFFNGLFAVFSNRDFSVLMGYQYLAQAGQGVIQGAIFKAIVFSGQKGFDIGVAPSADYLLTIVLLLYIPYTFVSPFVGVFIDRFERRTVAWWANVVSAGLVAVVAIAVVLPLANSSPEGKAVATTGLIVGLLLAQSVARIALAIKAAAIPDVLTGRDLLQGNGLSQAGGGLAQVVGIGFGTVLAGLVAPWVGVLFGAIVLIVSAVVARQLHRVEARHHEASFGQEAARIVRTMIDGVKEVAARPPAALGLTSFQMLRYQFWGFVLMTFALYAKELVKGGSADTLSQVLSGVGGLVGGALGLILAQKLKDRVPPIRLLLASMVLLGAGTLVFGAWATVAGFAALLFVGFFAFFLGKISADTITQQAMPDDFRGRAFALYDIAYNLGFIVPAAILSVIWIEDDPTRTKAILVVSGAIFLGFTALVAAWAGRIRPRFAPQDDLVGEEAAELATTEP